ncbi:MAG: hypothetical protein ABSC42_05875 [Tepidisphaeraceae bacterium]|jgi:hypothetical protein
MRSNLNLRVVANIVLLLLAVVTTPGRACLRDALDDRAVQWSTSIVMAKLTAVRSPQPMVASSTQPSADLASGVGYQIYEFEITSPIDGVGRAGDQIHVIRFIWGPGTESSSICGQAFTDKQVGKSFLLMLRPEADLRWSDRAGQGDPRTPQIHAMKAFVVVHLELASDLGAEGLEDAKYTVTSTRAAEAQFNADDAKLQAQTMINAADDTEEVQAEHALLEMGSKAIPVLSDAMSQAGADGKTRLQKVIRALSPPSLAASMHQR